MVAFRHSRHERSVFSFFFGFKLLIMERSKHGVWELLVCSFLGLGGSVDLGYRPFSTGLRAIFFFWMGLWSEVGNG